MSRRRALPALSIVRGRGRRFVGRATLPLLVATSGVALAPSIASASRLETIDVPSTKGHVKVDEVRLNDVDRLQANVLLPDGYDEDPNRRWPLLLLFHGVGDNAGGWVDPAKGDIRETAAGFPGIVVMPELGRDYLVDWWEGGRRDKAQWQRYMLEEVLPTIEARYRVAPGRRNHAVAGLSMGGYSAAVLAAQLPGYFGTVVSMSHFPDSQSPESVALVEADGRTKYDEIYGPVRGPYATVNSPQVTTSSLRATRDYVSTGNGIPDPAFPFSLSASTTGAAVELLTLRQSTVYATKAAFDGVPVTYRPSIGVHDWPYWRRELRRAIGWNLFGATPADDASANRSWTYATMAPRGNAWNLGYRFAQAPAVIATFTRSGQRLRIAGSGTVTVTPGAAEGDASGAGSQPGCAFTAALPVDRLLPTGC